MSNYPNSLPTFTEPASGSKLNNPNHITRHTSESNEIVAIATELGLNPKGSSISVKARLDALDGVRSVVVGGTGTSTTPTNGKILIGKTDGTYAVATLTQGNNITITNGDGTITITSTGATATRGTFAKTDLTYTFTIATPSVSPTAGATYTNNTFTFTVVSYAANVLVCTGTGFPTASGTLTKASGTGDATLTYTSFTATKVVTHNLGLSAPYTILKPTFVDNSGVMIGGC